MEVSLCFNLTYNADGLVEKKPFPMYMYTLDVTPTGQGQNK